ncbi:MAG: hypothetical protein AAGB11_14015 [Pseudomonadota bacterium]
MARAIVPLAAPLLGGATVVYALSAADASIPCLLDTGLVDPISDHCPQSHMGTVEEVAGLLERTTTIAAVCLAWFLIAILACYGMSRDKYKEDRFRPAFLPGVSLVRPDGGIRPAQSGSLVFGAMF